MPESIPLTFGAANLEEGWRGTPNELLQRFAELLFATISADFLTGSVDGTPGPDGGLWLHKLNDVLESYQASWYNTTYGKYLPIYTVPVGTVIMYAANDTPPNFLECDGSVKQVSDYPQLYAVIGNLWGGEDGLNFNVPDMRGRIPLGKGLGVDYLSGDKSLTERDMGVDNEGYLGHEFIHQVFRPANPPSTPGNQRVKLTPPEANTVTSGLPPATVLRFLIKYQ